MRTLAVTIMALVLGLIGGLVLSEIIGIIGVLVFDRFVGIRFLPLILGAGCAVAAPILDRRLRARSRS